MSPSPEGRIATFYSYKGGTGRSMALANFAWIMASSGKRVLVIDWDLEAPGLHRYFRPFLTDPELLETDGLIDAVWALAGTALAAAPSSTADMPEPSSDYDRVVDALQDSTRRLRPVDLPRESLRTSLPDRVESRVKIGNVRAAPPLPQLFPSGGSIDFIGAGRQGATYSARVNSFIWQRFYDLDGARLLNLAKQYFRKTYDWVLIDSRTGVSDTAGICTIQMPDTVVACFTPNRQSVTGVSDVLFSIRSQFSAASERPSIRFFPLATRIENLEPRKLEASRAYFRGRMAEFLPERFASNPREYWDSMEIPYKTGYAFEELLAAFGDATGALGAADTLLSKMETMARTIADDPHLGVAEIVESEREIVLQRYALEDPGAGLPPPAPSEPDAARPASRPEESDADVLRNVRAKEQVWRTHDFVWRALLSAREIDLLTEEDRKTFGRNMSFYLANSIRMRGFSQLTDLAFVLCYGSAIIGSLAFYFTNRVLDVSDSFYMRNYNFRVMNYSVVAFAVVYMIAFLFALSVCSRLPRKPYGVRLSTVARHILMGPLRREIRDYEHIDVRRSS